MSEAFRDLGAALERIAMLERENADDEPPEMSKDKVAGIKLFRSPSW